MAEVNAEQKAAGLAALKKIREAMRSRPMRRIQKEAAVPEDGLQEDVPPAVEEPASQPAEKKQLPVLESYVPHNARPAPAAAAKKRK